MILKTHNPRTAIIQSYNRPVLYKNHIHAAMVGTITINE